MQQQALYHLTDIFLILNHIQKHFIYQRNLITLQLKEIPRTEMHGQDTIDGFIDL